MHSSFLAVYDEGYFKQLYLIIYILLFFTALQNIFVAVIMEGYDRSIIRKAIDNNDPFPQAKSAAVAVRRHSMFTKVYQPKETTEETVLPPKDNVVGNDKGDETANSLPNLHIATEINDSMNNTSLAEMEPGTPILSIDNMDISPTKRARLNFEHSHTLLTEYFEKEGDTTKVLPKGISEEEEEEEKDVENTRSEGELEEQPNQSPLMVKSATLPQDSTMQALAQSQNSLVEEVQAQESKPGPRPLRKALTVAPQKESFRDLDEQLKGTVISLRQLSRKVN